MMKIEDMLVSDMVKDIVAEVLRYDAESNDLDQLKKRRDAMNEEIGKREGELRMPRKNFQPTYTVAIEDIIGEAVREAREAREEVSDGSFLSDTP